VENVEEATYDANDCYSVDSYHSWDSNEECNGDSDEDREDEVEGKEESKVQNLRISIGIGRQLVV